MSNNVNQSAKTLLSEITKHVQLQLLPFWINNSIDSEYGGYLTCFDQNGVLEENTDKYLVTQTRMLWGFSNFYRKFPQNEQIKKCAVQGVDFLIRNFWDNQNGGWYWAVDKSGSLLDDGKVVYGQAFAIYALSEYALATNDSVALSYAEKTFDLLQAFAADTARGGYYENFENDWSISEPGFAAGDRKSLDIHMHIMEAFTTLYLCTKKEVHKRKLQEIIDLLLTKMMDFDKGCGFNQFNISFEPIPAINIKRTWNAERFVGEEIKEPLETTSYGHNVEFLWLLQRAAMVLGKPQTAYNDICKKLVEHCLRYGFDFEYGGVYRDGVHDGPPLVKDKEWWQNCEVLVGFLEAYILFQDERYYEAFESTWNFDKKYFINEQVGEWRQLLTRNGDVIAGNIGNPWKGIYHTGRAMLESIERLEKIVASK
ncbi:AGE family epimerase/isomerase [Lachnospiraceae bacterium ZAX-1]